MKPPQDRYRVNQLVRTALVRHSVDLSAAGYSCSGRSVSLYGSLRKDPEGDFTPPEIESLFQELAAIDRTLFIEAEFDNWIVSSDAGSWLIMPKRAVSYGRDQKTLQISTKETLSETIRSIADKKSE